MVGNLLVILFSLYVGDTFPDGVAHPIIDEASGPT